MSKAGRPKNQWEVKRVSVPSELVPEIKKLIEQWKLNNERKTNNHNNTQQ